MDSFLSMVLGFIKDLKPQNLLLLSLILLVINIGAYADLYHKLERSTSEIKKLTSKVERLTKVQNISLSSHCHKQLSKMKEDEDGTVEIPRKDDINKIKRIYDNDYQGHISAACEMLILKMETT